MHKKTIKFFEDIFVVGFLIPSLITFVKQQKKTQTKLKLKNKKIMF
jgi:hypothetical protein